MQVVLKCETSSPEADTYIFVTRFSSTPRAFTFSTTLQPDFRYDFRLRLSLRATQYNVTVKNCRLGSTTNHIQYKYYARYECDLTMGYARMPAAYRAVPGKIII